MSIEGGYSTRTHDGPKLFTEYETNALLGLVAQLGVGILGLSNLIPVVFILSFLQIFITYLWSPEMVFLVVYFAAMVVLLPVNILQSYCGWQLHKQQATIERCVNMNILSLMMCIGGLVFIGLVTPLAILIGGQVLLVVAAIDVIAIALLRSDSGRREFRSSSQLESEEHSEYASN
ncbi:hypothetical protein EU546_04545 [Candidatus Thorarchaeota archaeon]|nr:MAG: hypothetical protein EU546_04545 [Candidatus Thorarchaeota archaeon]